MPDDKPSPWGEEYLPTAFHDRDGREYVIHVNVAVMQELGRRFNLTMGILQNPYTLPMHILTATAEIGTRYMWYAKHKQSEQDFLVHIGDENFQEMQGAAINAILNFSLRGNKDLTPEERRGTAERHMRDMQEIVSRVRENKNGLGETFIDSLAQQELTPQE